MNSPVNEKLTLMYKNLRQKNRNDINRNNIKINITKKTKIEKHIKTLEEKKIQKKRKKTKQQKLKIVWKVIDDISKGQTFLLFHMIKLMYDLEEKWNDMDIYYPSNKGPDICSQIMSLIEKTNFKDEYIGYFLLSICYKLDFHDNIHYHRPGDSFYACN